MDGQRKGNGTEVNAIHARHTILGHTMCPRNYDEEPLNQKARVFLAQEDSP